MCAIRLIFILTAVLFWILLCNFSGVVSGGPPSKKCPTITIPHGKTQYQQRRRFAKFQCLPGYMLAGNMRAYCVSGKWEGEIPKCVKPTCKRVKSPVNGISYTTPGLYGAVISFFCNYEYELQGHSVTYCNGTHWDNPLPTCLKDGKPPLKECSFEQDMCGWNHDLNHDFDWQRRQFSTPSTHVHTGPSFDHTKGPGRDGYYMYIESTSQKENDTARLISPIYTQPVECLELYYHMYGRTIGALNVYAVPVTNNSYNLIRLPRPLFARRGNHGDVWLRAVIHLDTVTPPFQIIIEGVRGPGYVSDIAIDDIKLLDICPIIDSINEITTDSLDIFTDDSMNSCLNRCDENNTVPSICECTPDCLLESTCCPDYIIVCDYGFSTTTNNYEDTVSTTDTDILYENTSRFVETEVPTTTTNSQTFTTKQTKSVERVTMKMKQDKLTTISKNVTTTKLPKIKFTSTTTTMLPTKSTYTVSVTTKSPSSTTNATNTPVKTFVRVAPTKKIKPTKMVQNNYFSTVSTKRLSMTTLNYEKSTKAKVTKKKMTTSNSTSKLNKNKTSYKDDIKTNNINENRVLKQKKVTLSTPIVTIAVNRMTASSLLTTKKPSMGSIKMIPEEKKDHTVIWVTATTLILLVVVATILVSIRRYRSFIRFRMNKLKNHRQSSDSVSDVRFLTSDEILDFTISRPADETERLL